MTDASSVFQPPDPAAYLRELVEVGRRHGFVLGHEDSHGAFQVRPRTSPRPFSPEHYEEWLLEADTDECPKPGGPRPFAEYGGIPADVDPRVVAALLEDACPNKKGCDAPHQAWQDCP